MALVESSFTVIQWNTRGIRNKFYWLKCQPFFHADVLVFQETFLNPGDNFSCPGKVVYRSDRTSRGGGLLFAVNNKFTSSPVYFNLPNTENNEVLGLKIWLRNQWLTIVNVYSPSGTFSDLWLLNLLNAIQPPFMILGDFNQKHVAWGNNFNTTGSDTILRWILNNNICILNTTNPTHIAPSGNRSLIDLSFSSADCYHSIHAFVHPDPFDSDHFPICMKLAFGTHNSQHTSYLIDWKQIDVCIAKWINQADSVSIAQFQHIFQTAKQCHTTKVSTRRRENPPWWDAQCSWLLGQKRKFLRLAKTHLNREYWLRYKNLSAQLRRYMKSKARNYWRTMCEEASQGKIYTIIKALAKKNTIADSNFLLVVDDDDILDQEGQANAFANYFSNPQTLPAIPFDLSSSNDYFNRCFTIEDLNLAIQQTKNTTPGEDGITAARLKALTKVGRFKLLETFNQIFMTGSVPDGWRTATILPIWKGGKPKNLISSYRPISLTSVLGKVMERLILKRIVDWAMEQQSFHPRQFGFLPNSDSTKAIYLLYHDLLKAKSNRKHTVAVKLDINAAYDSVWRDALIWKLVSLGITGNTALWIANWIGTRILKVKWRGCTSAPIFSYRGIPQGSVLSPILFTIYLSDLFEAIDSGVQFIVYADDIILYCSDVSIEYAREKLQDILTRLHQWCTYWKLDIRPDKCEAIIFSHRKVVSNRNLTLYGSDIPWANSVKILGVIFTHNLNFSLHISYLQKKCLKRLNLLKAIAARNWGVRTNDLIKMVNAIIRGTIEYSCAVYAKSAKNSLKRLDVLYNSALRFATGLPMWTPIFKLYREANQPPLAFRRDYLVAAFHIRCSPAANFQLPTPSFFSADFTWPIDNSAITPAMLIESYPPIGRIYDYVEIISEGLPFQSKHLPPATIQSWFYSVINEQYANFHIIATDASKDRNKTSIAAIDIPNNIKLAYLVHHLNSIFTAEILAINLALQSFIKKGNYVILTDSKSTLEALKNANYHSPPAILYLYNTIMRVRNEDNRFVFIWVPGHVGIFANEQADTLAKNGPFAIQRYSGVDPQDLKHNFKRILHEKFQNWWNQCKYAGDSSHLGNDIYKWPSTRKLDITIARLRTLSLTSDKRLFQFKLKITPACRFCNGDTGTEVHYILHCPFFSTERSQLFQKMNISSPISWCDFWNTLNNKNLLHCFARLFLDGGRL